MRPSRGLEEVLMGVALKQAKRRFEAREGAEGATGMVDFENDQVAADSIIKEGSQGPTPAALVTVVSTDDERSRQLLRPSIRTMFSTLERTLMALQHTMGNMSSIHVTF